MSSEITAWFPNIDAAETAARQLRRRGRGIRSLKIRQPHTVSDLSEPILSPLSGYSLPLGEAFLSGGSFGVMPLLPVSFKNADRPPEPFQDSSCLMVMKSDDKSASFNVSLLHALHAERVHSVSGLPR